MNGIAISEHASLAQVMVEKWGGDRHDFCCDYVAEEVPIALEYNGIAHAVMMASPHDLEDFALGFSLSEGILGDRSELFDCEISAAGQGIRLQMQIAAQRFAALKAVRRQMSGRTGCGLCGIETLQQAIRPIRPVASSARFSSASIHAGFRALQERQHVQRATGAAHAAGWLNADGKIQVVREDIGRHNAMDKMIGALARAGQDFSQGAALITSRASFEMVQKAAAVGIGMLAAISAPTGLAIQLARSANISLLGFVRHASDVTYTGSHRLIRDMPVEFSLGRLSGSTE